MSITLRQTGKIYKIEPDDTKGINEFIEYLSSQGFDIRLSGESLTHYSIHAPVHTRPRVDKNG